MIKKSLVVITILLLSACGTSSVKMVHPQIGTVSANDPAFIQERDDCLAEFIQAESKKSETREQEETIKTTSLLSNDLAAMMELSGALGSNKRATSYTEDCLEKKGWSKQSGS